VKSGQQRDIYITAIQVAYKQKTDVHDFKWYSDQHVSFSAVFDDFTYELWSYG